MDNKKKKEQGSGTFRHKILNIVGTILGSPKFSGVSPSLVGSVSRV